jgi:16S rRNA processing protein RimM
MVKAPVSQWVLLGRVLVPFGVKGWVKVEPFTETPESLRKFGEWRLGRGEPSDAWQTVRIAESASHSGNVVARFEGCGDRDAALLFRGMGIAVPRALLPAVKPGEYYQSDLVGLQVLNMQGEELGQVAGLFSNGAHEILRVEHDGGERLLPLVPAIVQGVDTDAGVVRVDWQSDW